MVHARLDLALGREHQRDLLTAAAAWRVSQQVRVHNRIARRAQRLERLQKRHRDQVARLRGRLEQLESVG